jgi:catechol 2,3-dioxygenase-like lactoylglutathione lyase family enzyme
MLKLSVVQSDLGCRRGARQTGRRGPRSRPDAVSKVAAMLAHVTIRAEDRAASERFYRTVLGAVGIEPTHELEEIVAWDDFAIIQADTGHPPTRHLHVAFVAPSREGVDAFWRTGVDAGYRSDGEPGERPQNKPEYYGSFLLDPDGNSAEAVDHGDTRRGGNIDHLWIRVRSVAASEAFYRTIARYTGLREGRRWDTGVQFRGAWATFSLVHDELPATDQLHIAFPAPDSQTVEDFHRAATSAGYRSNGEPGERPHYGPGYYAAYVLDPDDTNVESVFYAGRNY